MSKKILISLLLFCLGLFSQAQSYQKMPQGIKATVQGMDVEVAFYTHPSSGFIRHRREARMTRRAL